MAFSERESVNRTESEAGRSKELEFDRFLLEHAPVNAGTNALIFKVTSEEIPDDTRAKYKALNNRNDNAALKVLKVYSQGRGEREFNAQTQAYTIIEQARSSGADLALVPTPLEWKKIHIEDETKQLLNTEGASLLSNDAEILMMDFVEGDDLATVFYKWIVDHAPADKQYIAQSVNPSSFEDLQRAVSEILQFIKPGGRSFNEAARAGEEKRAANMNAEKAYRFLRKTGFRLNPRVVTQIKNTLKVFQSQGFFHNDDHERNFMVVGDHSGSGEVQTYIIDFDKAGVKAEDQAGDFRIDRLLAQLTDEAEGEKNRELAEFEAKLESEEWQDRMSGFLEAGNEKQIYSRLITNSTVAASSEGSFDDFIAVMMKLNRDGRLEKSIAGQILDRVRESLVVKDSRKKQSRIINPNVYNKAVKYKTLFQ
jgi:hypothetical protein